MNGIPAIGRQGARLGAVQALYQIDMAGGSAKTVVREFLDHRFVAPEGKRKRPEVDRTLFARVVEGAAASKVELDEALVGALAEGWRLARIEPVIRAILRAGAYELASCPDVPARVVLKEYLDVAGIFYRGPEIKFINGVLNRLARHCRGEEFEHDHVEKKPRYPRRRKAR